MPECNQNRIVKTSTKIPHNQCVSFKLFLFTVDADWGWDSIIFKPQIIFNSQIEEKQTCNTCKSTSFLPAVFDFHHSFETCGVNWRLVSLCNAFILKIIKMLFTATISHLPFHTKYYANCKGQKNTNKCSPFKNEDILQILCTTEKWLNLWQVCRQQMQECTIYKRLAFFQFNSKFAIYNKKDLTMQFMSLHTMLTGECCDSKRFANDIASGHDDEYFQISDCQNKVGTSCCFVHTRSLLENEFYKISGISCVSSFDVKLKNNMKNLKLLPQFFF